MLDSKMMCQGPLLPVRQPTNMAQKDLPSVDVFHVLIQAVLFMTDSTTEGAAHGWFFITIMDLF